MYKVESFIEARDAQEILERIEKELEDLEFEYYGNTFTLDECNSIKKIKEAAYERLKRGLSSFYSEQMKLNRKVFLESTK